MFQATANTGQIVARAQSICQALRDNLNAAEAFYDWLIAQDDTEFTNLPNGLVLADVNTLRAAFADLHALNLLVNGAPAPASYALTGQYDFTTNIKEIVGAA